ncbi:hypothetical protein V6N12_007296 [Hibiscus sabdariffa]|uniref:ALOG domain-containing protein n=1 Tax=Hibiscus sabdariffa TaxID=183260 RepID=A0ABR2F1B9_9ROSI
MSINKGKQIAQGSSRSAAVGVADQQNPPPLSRYESQKMRDWITFAQYLRNRRPPVALSQQAWGSLDALIGRLHAAYEENDGSRKTNPFANAAIRIYLREVRDSQAKARGIPYKKKKKKRDPLKSNEEDNSSFL